MRKIIYYIVHLIGLLGIVAYVLWDKAWIMGVFVLAPALVCFMIFSDTTDELEHLKGVSARMTDKIILDESAIKRCIAEAYRCHPNDIIFEGKFESKEMELGKRYPVNIQCMIDKSLKRWVCQEVETGNIRMIEGPRWLKPGQVMYTKPEIIIVSEVKDENS